MSVPTGESCAACGVGFPPGAHFCPGCGAPTSPSACASCREPLTSGARFCAACGTAVGSPSASNGRATASETTGGAAERRVTSVLFADLVGFTPLSESRDSEDMRDLLSRYFDECRTVIGRYGGIVEKFIGDAVMAVWGAPIAHEDDAERAVRAGMDLLQMVAGMGEAVGAPGLAMRVGVVTGEVAVMVGAAAEALVAGDVVNTASRVQSIAAPGQLWVDDMTRSLTSAAIAYEDTGEHALKGKAEPLRLWHARAVVAAVGGALRVDGLEAPLTGRDGELRLLKELFHGTEEAGRPRLLLLDGEAGVGKSRLAWEFEKYIDGLTEEVLWHRGRCLSYGDGIAFWALAEAVRGRLGLVELDTGPTVTQHLDAWLDANTVDAAERDWLATRLSALLGEASGASFTRDDLFAAWTAFLERVGADDPVVIVLDDLQNADDGLLDFLGHLVTVAHTPIFILALSRPELLERRPQLAIGRRNTVIHLEPLAPAEMAEVIDSLVHGLPQPMRDGLVSRAEGIPLFAVETIRALIDRDLVIARDGRYVLAEGADTDLSDIGAPASLQALVASRLDALTPTERRVVTDASVLGASFSRDGIGVLAHDVPDVDVVLDALRRKEIFSIQTDRLSAERGQFRFVQSVVRQVAYATQGKRDRKQRHLAVAAFLQTLPDPGDDLAVLVAQHLLDAVSASSVGDPDVADLTHRAKDLLVRAGQRAFALGSPSEALDLFRSALAQAQDPAERAPLLESASLAARDAGKADDAVALAREACDGWEALGDPVGAGRAAALEGDAASTLAGDKGALIGPLREHWDSLVDRPDAESALLPLAAVLARLHAHRDEYELSRAYLERQIRIAESVGDGVQMATAMTRLATILSDTGAPRSAAILWQGIARYAADNGLTALEAQLSMLLATYEVSRDARAGLSQFRDALELARRAGDQPRVTLIRDNISLVLWTTGQWQELGAMAASEALGDEVQTSLMHGWVSLAQGSVYAWPPIEAVEQGVMETTIDIWVLFYEMERARALGETRAAARTAEVLVNAAFTSMGMEDDFGRVWPAAALAAIEADDLDLAARLIERVSSAPRGLVTPVVAAQDLRMRGLLGIARSDDPASTEQHLRAAIGALDAYGAVPDRAQTEEALGHWLLDQGRPADAEPLLESARATYVELGATAWLERMRTPSQSVTG